MNRCPHLQLLHKHIASRKEKDVWRLAWWPMRHSRVRAETGEAVGAAGGRQPLVKFLLWFKTTNTWSGRKLCPLQNNGCTCRSLLDARSEAAVLCLLLPTMQNVVCINEVLLPFPGGAVEPVALFLQYSSNFNSNFIGCSTDGFRSLSFLFPTGPFLEIPATVIFQCIYTSTSKVFSSNQ